MISLIIDRFHRILNIDYLLFQALFDSFSVVSDALYPNVNIDDIALSLCAKLLPLFGFGGTENCPYLLKQYVPDVRI